MKTKYFTEELSNISGIVKPIEVNYRLKQKDKNANNFAFEFHAINKTSKLTWNPEPGHYWRNRIFTPNACNSCTDTFAETTDIVIMDAWLPEYSKDYRGHTLLLVRNQKLNDLLLESNELIVKDIAPSKVSLSQKGVIINKKVFSQGTKNPILKRVVNNKLKIQKLSLWNKYDENKEEIDLLVLDTKKYEKILWYLSLPTKIISKIKKKLKR